MFKPSKSSLSNVRFLKTPHDVYINHAMYGLNSLLSMHVQMAEYCTVSNQSSHLKLLVVVSIVYSNDKDTLDIISDIVITMFHIISQ